MHDVRTQAVKRVCRDFSSILNDALTDNIIAMATEYTTIESRVAATILERTVGTLEIEGVTYNIAPPTIGTLILASEIVSYFPKVEDVKDEQRVFKALFTAKDFKRLAELGAVLILGAKHQYEQREQTIVKRYLFGLFKRKKTVTVEVDVRAELAQKILDNVRPSVLFEVIIKRLRDNEIMTFFAITTSLNEANILKPTKAEVVKD